MSKKAPQTVPTTCPEKKKIIHKTTPAFSKQLETVSVSVSADVQIDPEMIKQLEEAQKKKEAENRVGEIS